MINLLELQSLITSIGKVVLISSSQGSVINAWLRNGIASHNCLKIIAWA